MPANNRIGLYKDHRSLPSRPESPQDHPKQPVRSGKPWLRMLSLQDTELLPQRQVFQD
jgi:hypothetical protein